MNFLLLTSMLGLCLSPDYYFIEEYAPRIWLDKNESYMPCSIEYFNNYTHTQCINEKTWIISNQKLTNPSEILPYFLGQNPNTTSVPVYVIITPDLNESDPVRSIEDPKNHSIIATYFTLYPYNRGKKILDTIWGNHVGDIEHTHIYFEKGKPTKIIASYHSWNTTKLWGDPTIEMVGTHPVLYSAQGSHGLWFSSGKHNYMKFPELNDFTSNGTAWDTWNNLEIILPEDWGSSYWLDTVFRWGDPHTEFTIDNCYNIFGDVFCRFDDGPVGFLGKSLISEIIQDLYEKGIVCDDCIWNAGIFN